MSEKKLALDELTEQSLLTADDSADRAGGGKPGGAVSAQCVTTTAPFCLASCGIVICGDTNGICPSRGRGIVVASANRVLDGTGSPGM